MPSVWTKWDLQNRLLFNGILFFRCSKTYNVTFVRHGIILKTNKKVFKRMLLSILLYWSLWINSRTKRKYIWCTTSVRKPSRLRLWIQFFRWWEYYKNSINIMIMRHSFEIFQFHCKSTIEIYRDIKKCTTYIKYAKLHVYWWYEWRLRQ